MSLGSAAISIDEVRKWRRDHAGQPVEVLKGLSLAVPEHQVTVVIGPSGGGKSTLVRLINRLEDPSSGQISLFAENILNLDVLQLRRRIGVVPQKPLMFDGSVMENLQRPFEYRGESPPGPEDDLTISTLSLCRLKASLLPQKARSLSLGEQQRVSLARALICRPNILVLDEPTSALDRPTADRLAATLRDICGKQNLTMLMVTHDLRLAEQVADRIAYLEDGRILEQGAAKALFAAPASDALRSFLTSSGGS